jgi:hypothetical protein
MGTTKNNKPYPPKLVITQGMFSGKKGKTPSEMVDNYKNKIKIVACHLMVHIMATKGTFFSHFCPE